MENSELHNKEMIGPYEVIRSISKGGMGEVFLVFDPLCKRKIALKKILPDLASHLVIKQRFLKEARVASKLSHPCIIPIYSIEQEKDIYYTMPFIEGETLKELFRSTTEKEKKGLAPHEIGVSIPALIRVFLSVCQAIAYAHSKSILHRDLKPENIMVGRFGEVFVLDWGIATYLDEKDEAEDDIEVNEEPQLTRPGKVLGTTNFMAPERALRQPATIQSEIYSLGVILYQILTLTLPFTRRNLEHFRRVMHVEKIIPPEEVAPYRDIPKQLSQIAMKCLAFDPKDRYQTIQEMIFDLENYSEGKPDWVFTTALDINKKEDWEFQENILLSKHMAVSRIMDVLEWVGLMISREAFSGNLKIEFEVTLPEESEGIGILMCVPEPSDRKGLEDGYCVWIGSKSHPYTVLFRSNAEIMLIPDESIVSSVSRHVRIEKVDTHVRVYIDGNLKLNYISHIPIVGANVGFVYKHLDFSISPIYIYTGSQSVMVNCLSVPDAFLASKNFDKAFVEYVKIANSFHGRTEGREAQFRAGLTLLEQGKREKNRKKREFFFSQALEEFEKLQATSGAPLEYLGKSFVYYALEDIDEEIKCFELMLRRYPKHPLLSILKEQVVFRLHETSKQDRQSAYAFALIAFRYLPEIFSSENNIRLIEHLTRNWTILAFVDNEIAFTEKKDVYIHYAIQLAFWLNKPLSITDIIDTIPEDLPEARSMIINSIYELLYLGCIHSVAAKLLEKEELLKSEAGVVFPYNIIQHLLLYKDPIATFEVLLSEGWKLDKLRAFNLLVEYSKRANRSGELIPHLAKLLKQELEEKDKENVMLQYLKLIMYERDFNLAGQLIKQFPESKIKDPKSSLHFIYGCFLFATKGENEALQHFASVPSESIFISQHLTPYYKERDESKLFFWEKIKRYRKLAFFYQVIDKRKEAVFWAKKIDSLFSAQEPF